jgi:hypothetical protein
MSFISMDNLPAHSQVKASKAITFAAQFFVAA